MSDSDEVRAWENVQEVIGQLFGFDLMLQQTMFVLVRYPVIKLTELANALKTADAVVWSVIEKMESSGIIAIYVVPQCSDLVVLDRKTTMSRIHAMFLVPEFEKCVSVQRKQCLNHLMTIVGRARHYFESVCPVDMDFPVPSTRKKADVLTPTTAHTRNHGTSPRRCKRTQKVIAR